MRENPPPVSVVANEIREIMNDKSSTDFNIYYDDYTIYGDLQYIRVKVRSAWQKKSQDNFNKSDYQVKKKEKIQRPDLFAGELEFAVNRISKLLEKLDSTDDHYGIEKMVRKHKKILEEHKRKADNGEIYYPD